MKRALISVSDKTGLVEFARGLIELGFEIISTGGTYKTLTESGVPVKGVSEITGFPECLDGRLKTLHPRIHGGLLAVRNNRNHMDQLFELGIGLIDMLVVNLYPFKDTIAKKDATLEDAIENIDIGGPAMLRSAAKNYQDVTAITDPADYGGILEELQNSGSISRETGLRLAAKVFARTSHYDCLIADYMGRLTGAELFPPALTLTYEKLCDLSYGENPHQKAAFYTETPKKAGSISEFIQLHGKALSFNNINDAHGAVETLGEFDEPTVVACKHGNPCGVGSGRDIYDAYAKAFSADPVSIFGGIIAANREIDEETAVEINKIFIDVVIAKSYSPAALEILKKKKNIRLLELPCIDRRYNGEALDLKKVSGGLLAQTTDGILLGGDIKCVTDRAPTEEETANMLYAFKLVKALKSNAIAIAKDSRSLGLGCGQVRRIWACEQAIEHCAETLGAEELKGSALASDAYFPFPDCVEAAYNAGIRAVIQPGGSVNDQKSIDFCNEHGITMVFTGTRHFKH